MFPTNSFNLESRWSGVIMNLYLDVQGNSNRGGTSDQEGFPVFICHGFTTNKLSYYIILEIKMFPF